MEPRYFGPALHKPCAIVAIPAKDEALRLPACLAAMAGQVGVRGRLLVLLFVNGSTDRSATLAATTAERLGVPLALVETTLPPPLAHAGGARRGAMHLAAGLLEQERVRGGVVLTTDADTVVAPDWVRANLAAIDAGADLVCGAIRGDPAEEAALPPQVTRVARALGRYQRLLDRLAMLIDPEPGDPWPRHTDGSGASLAVRHGVYRALGGLTPKVAGEDVDLVAAVRRHDGIVRHDPAVRVVTSCRMVGRASGGMADTLVRWAARGGSDPADAVPALWPFGFALRLRARIRAVHRGGWAGEPATLLPLAEAIRVAPAELAACLAIPTYGAAIEQLAAVSPALRPRRVLLSEVAQETRMAMTLLGRPRAAWLSAAPSRPAGSRLSATLAAAE